MSIGGQDEWVSVARDKDDNCIPIFHLRAVHMKARSEQEGRPVYENRVFVEVFAPGSKNEVHVAQVKDEHKKRWPVEWAKFERNNDTTVEGTPLEQWPFLDAARIAELKHYNILTVEHVLNVSDANKHVLGLDANKLQERARQFLQGSSDTEKELRAEIAELKSRLDRAEQASAQRRQQPKIEEEEVPKPATRRKKT